MAKRPLLVGFCAIAASLLAVIVAAALALSPDADGRSYLTRAIETAASGPGQSVSISGVNGFLSPDLRIGLIKIADGNGVWLTVRDVRLVWRRAALLAGAFEAQLLEAAEIEILRVPQEQVTATEESGGLDFRNLPLAIRIARIEVPRLLLGQALLGTSAALALNGNARLTNAELGGRLDVERYDRPGSYRLEALYDVSAGELTLDAGVTEPRGGLIATALDLPHKPPIGFALKGSGTLDRFDSRLALEADGARLLSGRATTARTGNGHRLQLALEGTLDSILPPEFRDLLGGGLGIEVDAARSNNGAISLVRAEWRAEAVSAVASGQIAPDGFPTRLELNAQLGRKDGKPLHLPLSGKAKLQTADIVASFGVASSGMWNASAAIVGLETPDLAAETTQIEASGRAIHLRQPDRRSLTYDFSGEASGFRSGIAGLADALGARLTLAAKGKWQAGESIEVERSSVALPNASLRYAGNISLDESAQGRAELRVSDLSPFSGLAGEALRGALQLATEGNAQLPGLQMKANFEGTFSDLSYGEMTGTLFAGETRLSGGIAVNDAGIEVDRLKLGNSRFDVSADGVYGPSSNLALNVLLSDLSSLATQAAGGIVVDARLTGSNLSPTIEATAEGRELVLLEKPFNDARLEIVGELAGADAEAKVIVTGNLAGAPVDVSLALATLNSGERALRDLDIRVGDTRASGDLTLSPDGLADGTIALTSQNLSDIGALLLMDASGALDAEIVFSADGGGQSADIAAEAHDVAFGQTRIGSADITMTARNIYTRPALAGAVAAKDVIAGGLIVHSLTARAAPADQGTRIDASAELAQGKLTASGSLQPNAEGFDLALQTFALNGATRIALAEPATLSIADGKVAVPQTLLDFGDGRITISGRAGETLDVTAAITSLPLSMANAFVNGLGAEGTLSGIVRLSGAAADPVVTLSAQARQFAAKAARDAGAPAVDVALNGELARQIVTFEVRVTGPSGLEVQANGKAPLEGDGLDVKVNGSVPLALAERALAERGARIAGIAKIDASLSGALRAPHYGGVITTKGASFDDGASGLTLTNIALRAKLTQKRLQIEQLTGNSGQGRVSVTGSVGLDDGFPADIAIALRNAVYEDGELVDATASGNLTFKGQLAEARVSGRVNIERAEITVPEAMPAGSVAVAVKHTGADAAVTRTLRSAGFDKPARHESSQGSGGPTLDLTISAPARIFLRGRGLDAELGGEVKLKGKADNLAAQGSFSMRRGRLTIVGQRINFNRGEVTLDGDLDPLLDFSATTRGQGIVVTATVTGRASDPEIRLSSVPELPQDEVLAQFLFKRSVSQLSPVQMAQIAAAAAQLGGLGGGGPGILGNLRAATGLDDLDVETDAQGRTGVRAGRYINENIYLGVRGGEAHSSGVTLDMNLTDSLKARGETDATGRSSFGLFFEREY